MALAVPLIVTLAATDGHVVTVAMLPPEGVATSVTVCVAEAEHPLPLSVATSV